MKYIHMDGVEPGQYLGRTIFSASGAILLAEGVQLTVFMIHTLRRIGVTMIFIKDPRLEDVAIPEMVSEDNKREVMQRLGEVMQAVRSGKDFDARNTSQVIDQLIEDIVHNQEVLLQLTDIRTHDNEQYIHALNVCTISSLIGLNMGLNPVQLKELAIGALLHDIGKTELIHDDTMDDPRRHHTWRGFELLKLKREYSLLIAHVAFQHHEALDGSGFPRGLQEEDIHLYARVVAVANMYDRLRYRTVNGDQDLPMPDQACEQLMAMAGRELDHDVVIHFLRTVSIYPTGASVRLTTKETGVVVGQHRGLPSRPIVRIVTKDSGNDYDVKEVDLAKHTTIFIESLMM